jgi:O-antigen/teichoic acid export membrane protein
MYLDLLESVIPVAVFLAIFIKTGASLEAAVSSFAVANALVLVLVLVDAYRRGQFAYTSAPQLLNLVRRMWPAGSQTQAAQLAGISLARADLIIAGPLLGMFGLGIYSVAASLSDMMLKLADAVSWVLLPRAALLSDEDARGLSARYMRLVAMATAALAVPYLAVLVVIVPLLLGNRFDGVISILAVLLPRSVLMSIIRILGADLTARGSARTSAASLWLATVAFIIMAPVAAWLSGGVGLAAASSVSHLIAAAYLLRRYSLAGGVSVASILKPRLMDWPIKTSTAL